MTSIGKGWDINTITPSQWTKLIASTSVKGETPICWDSSRNIKCIEDTTVPDGFHRITLSEIWSISLNVLTKDRASFEEGRVIGPELLKQLKVLVTAEDERIKNIKSSAFQGQSKLVESVKKELNGIAGTLNPSTQAGTEFLEKAIKSNDLPALKIWIAFGGNLNQHMRSGITPLTHFLRSSKDPNLAMLQFFVKMGADLKQALKQLGFSKLMYAAYKGDLEAVKRILTTRTKTMLGNAKDKEGNTALIWALRMNNADVVRYMVNMGVDINAKNKEGHRALFYTSFNLEISNLLLQKGAKNDLGKTYLMGAIEQGTLDGLNIDSMDSAYLNVKSENGYTALHYAAFKGMTELVEQLIKRGADINAVNNDGRTPLFMAVMAQKIDVVKKLIQLGADLNVKDHEDVRAYNSVVEKGDIDQQIRSLLAVGGAKDNDGTNLLMRAVCSHHVMTVDVFAAKFDLNEESDKGFTALSYAIEDAIIRGWNFSIVEKLLKAGASVRTRSESGDPLELIISTENEDIKPEIIDWARPSSTNMEPNCDQLRN